MLDEMPVWFIDKDFSFIYRLLILTFKKLIKWVLFNLLNKGYITNLEMSFFSTLKHRLPSEFLGKSFPSPAQCLINSVGTSRRFAQPALKEEEEEVEEIEVDQRRLPADYDPATLDPTETS